MIFCRTCGKQLMSQSKFCNGCGTPAAPRQGNKPTPAPMQYRQPHEAHFPQTRTQQKRLVRALTATLAAMIIATMLLSWITIHVELNRDATRSIVDNLEPIIEVWLDAHVELLYMPVILHEIRYVIDGISGLSFYLSYSAYSLAYITRLLEAVSEAAPAASEIGVLADGTVNLVANVLRAVWAICILLLALYLFLLTAESKAAGSVGLIGTGFAFVLALVFAVGIFVGNSMLAETLGDFLQISAAIWVYVCLGLSLTAVVLLAVNKKAI